jgi:hypothetical protein
VQLSDPHAPNPTFTTPEGVANTDLTFELRVSDGSATSVDTVSVRVAAAPSTAGAAPPPATPASAPPQPSPETVEPADSAATDSAAGADRDGAASSVSGVTVASTASAPAAPTQAAPAASTPSAPSSDAVANPSHSEPRAVINPRRDLTDGATAAGGELEWDGGEEIQVLDAHDRADVDLQEAAAAAQLEVERLSESLLGDSGVIPGGAFVAEADSAAETELDLAWTRPPATSDGRAAASSMSSDGAAFDEVPLDLAGVDERGRPHFEPGQPVWVRPIDEPSTSTDEARPRGSDQTTDTSRRFERFAQRGPADTPETARAPQSRFEEPVAATHAPSQSGWLAALWGLLRGRAGTVDSAHESTVDTADRKDANVKRK